MATSVLLALRALEEKKTTTKPHTVRLGEILDRAVELRARSFGRSTAEHLRYLAYYDCFGSVAMLAGLFEELNQHLAPDRGGFSAAGARKAA